MAESKSGSFIVNNNTGSFTVNVDADQLTDGQKTMSVQIRKDSVRGQVIGNLSAPITINDTSFTPAGTIVSQGCVPGTYTYRVTKANGTGGVYNEDTPNSVSCGYVAPPTYPPAGTILSQGCVPGTYTYRITRANGSGGTTIEDTPNSVSCGYVAPTNPVYSFTRSVNNINEGSSFNITFNTNQSGSFPYTISGVSSADVGGASLSGSVTNGQVLTFNVTSDATTEGTETFTISLNNGQASTSVTINDTSTTPNPGNVTTRTVNYNPAVNGDFTVFSSTGNLIAWVGGLTLNNFKIDASEAVTIRNNSVLRQLFSAAGYNSAETDTEINNTISLMNDNITTTFGNNTEMIVYLNSPSIYTTSTTITRNNKIYTKLSGPGTQVTFKIDLNQFLTPSRVNSIADLATTEIANYIIQAGGTVTQQQRNSMKDIIVTFLNIITQVSTSSTVTDIRNLAETSTNTLINNYVNLGGTSPTSQQRILLRDTLAGVAAIILIFKLLAEPISDAVFLYNYTERPV